MSEKKYDQSLVARVVAIREGLGAQTLAALWHVDPSLREEAPKYRRILSKKVYGGDLSYVKRMEDAKKKLLKAQVKK